MRYASLSAALASAPPTPSLLGGGSDSLRLALGLDSTAARPRLPCHQPQVCVAGRLLGGSAGPALRGQIPRLLHGACGYVFKAYVRPSDHGRGGRRSYEPWTPTPTRHLLVFGLPLTSPLSRDAATAPAQRALQRSGSATDSGRGPPIGGSSSAGRRPCGGGSWCAWSCSVWPWRVDCVKKIGDRSH
jgi:hypothetical protein